MVIGCCLSLGLAGANGRLLAATVTWDKHSLLSYRRGNLHVSGVSLTGVACLDIIFSYLKLISLVYIHFVTGADKTDMFTTRDYLFPTRPESERHLV